MKHGKQAILDITTAVSKEIGVEIHYDGPQLDVYGNVAYQQFTVLGEPPLNGATFVVAQKVTFDSVMEEVTRFIETFKNAKEGKNETNRG